MAKSSFKSENPLGMTRDGGTQSSKKAKQPKKNKKGEGKREERSNSDDGLGKEYRDVRQKYLVLQEERVLLGRELRDIEGEVKGLEEEKLALLDELVVLEGLVNCPSTSHYIKGEKQLA